MRAVDTNVLVRIMTRDDAGQAEAAERFVTFHKRPSLGFSDCLVLEIARKAGHLPLGSFDRRLSKLDGVEKL
jgi:predicted nucleic acid-binding protein